jgi:hypothetical protein
MANDVTWWERYRPGKKTPENRNQNEQDTGEEIPGDADAPDIVGRTGEEMPEVAHDDGDGEYPDDVVGAPPDSAIPRNSDDDR